MRIRPLLLVSALAAMATMAEVSQAMGATKRKGAEASVIDCNRARRDGPTCMACNIYFEARGEPVTGQVKVAKVTMERVRSPRYPDTICAVVWQPYQFSWTKDGKPDRVTDRDAWTRATFLAGSVISEYRQGRKSKASKSYVDTGKNMSGVLWYHSKSVKPKWSRKMRRHVTEGGHIFYRPR